jgi:Ca-activated chloride channel family protein
MLYALWLLLVIAGAKPQYIGEPIRLKNEGRDIMLVLDISTSMTEKDFLYSGQRISRLEAVKRVVSEFADKRANDRIGLILFGTRAYLQSPLTFDKASIKEILWAMRAGMAGDSTSIGDALGLALKNLREDKNKDKKIIILLTDGENNDGLVSMGQAIKLAADENIKTYTIGVGSPNVFFKMISLSSSGVDERAMSELAKLTKGQYFKAENTAELQKIYQIIDKLEPTTNDEKYISEITELYYVPLLLAVFLGVLMFYILRGAK